MGLVGVVVRSAVERAVALELAPNAQRAVGTAEIEILVAIAGANRTLHLGPNGAETAPARHFIRRREPDRERRQWTREHQTRDSRQEIVT